MCKRIVAVIALSVAGSGNLRADPAGESDRQEFQQVYAGQLKNSPSIFSSAPIYHIDLADKKITFAGSYDYTDVSVAPLGVDISSKRIGIGERLDYTGWTASPYVAFSTKHLGFGFAGEVGKREAHFLRLPVSASPTTGAPPESYEEQYGVANYSGVGLYLYWIPTWDVFPTYVVPTFIGGGKSLNVTHQSSGTLNDEYAPVTMSKYRYAVQNYDAGCNVGLHFGKHFNVIPWVDYSANYVSAPQSTTGDSSPVDQAVTDDIALFWKSAPSLDYGIDFAVNIEGLDIHLGGLIGILGTLNKGSDRIQDNSRTVSISFITKGG